MNALRSLSKYVSLALGDSWSIEFAPNEAAGFARPTARIEQATGISSTPFGPFRRDLRQSLSTVCFPSPGINPSSSALEAHRVAGVLLDAVTAGIDKASFGNYDQLRRHPMRIPLFDYSQVGLWEAATEANRIGFMRVIESPSFEVLSDPADDGNYLVVGTLRLTWSESVARTPGPPIKGVTLGAGP